MKKQMYTLVLAGLCLGAQPVQTMNWENAKYYGGKALAVPGALGRGALWATGYVPRTVLGYTLEPMLNLLNLQSWVKKWNTYSDTTKNAIATTLVTTPAMMYILYKNPELLNTIIVSSGYKKWRTIKGIESFPLRDQFAKELINYEKRIQQFGKGNLSLDEQKSYTLGKAMIGDLGITPLDILKGNLTWPRWVDIIDKILEMLDWLYRRIAFRKDKRWAF